MYHIILSAIELPIHWNVQKKWKNKFFEIVDYFEFAISIILLIGLTVYYKFIISMHIFNLKIALIYEVSY